jgi:hypothetical protein
MRRAAPWVLCAISVTVLVVTSWLRWLTRGEAQLSDFGWLDGVITALGFVGFPVVGALIAARLPANPIGWLWCAEGFVYAVSDAALPVSRAAGWPAWVAWTWLAWGFVSFLAVLAFVFLLFPDGHLPSHRWRWVARAAVTGTVLLIIVVPLAPDPNGNPSQASPWAVHGDGGRSVNQITMGLLYAMFVVVLVAMVSLVVRFRRAGSVERRQLAWFLYATVVNGVLFVLGTALGILPPSVIGSVVSAAAFALLPVAVGIAILRYRLYEIDRIVSRTVSYGLLTGGLVGLYLLVVALLRPLLEPLTGSSTLAVAGSTLAVAAVFNPARRRLQEAVDRRFDRARYDGARAVDAFAARLRNQVDLDEVTAGLRDTVAATIAPTRVAVWLCDPTRSGGRQP